MIAFVFLADRRQNVDFVHIRNKHAHLVDMWKVSICEAHSLCCRALILKMVRNQIHHLHLDILSYILYRFSLVTVWLNLSAGDQCSSASQGFVLLKISLSSLAS